MGLSRTPWTIARLSALSADDRVSQVKAFFVQLDFSQDSEIISIASREPIAVEPDERLALVSATLEAAMLICTDDKDALLEWTFSPVRLATADVRDALADWRSADEPPLFSLLTLERRAVGDALGQAIATVGLAGFTGYEVAVVESPTLDRQQAGRLVTWLARSALAGIALKPGRFLGPGGEGICVLTAIGGDAGAGLIQADMVSGDTESD